MNSRGASRSVRPTGDQCADCKIKIALKPGQELVVFPVQPLDRSDNAVCRPGDRIVIVIYGVTDSQEVQTEGLRADGFKENDPLRLLRRCAADNLLCQLAMRVDDHTGRAVGKISQNKILKDCGLAGSRLPDDRDTKDPVLVSQPDFLARLGVDAKTDVVGVVFGEDSAGS